MRHLKAGRHLNRSASHRQALMRNLTRALIEHDRIITTVAKAKEVRPFIEKLITLAKKNTLHARRLAVARLHDKEAVAKLFTEIAPRYADRPGGYTRIIKRHERRLGDAGHTAFIELLKEGETKVRSRQPAPPPAPKVSAPPPAPTPPEPTPPAPESSSAPPAPAPEPQTPPAQ
jgi:large subunit ribosomal protein L17